MAAIRGINFDLVGREDLRRMLEQLPKRTRDKIFAASFRKRLRPVRDAARANAPVLQDVNTLGSTSQGRVPGTMRRNIKTAKKFAGRGRLGVGIYIAKRESFGISGDSKWFYPAHVHYGHSVMDATTYRRLGGRDLAAMGAKTGKTARKVRESLLKTGEAKRNVEPRPFMRDAWMAHKSSVEAGVIAGVKEQLALEARDLMGKSKAS